MKIPYPLRCTACDSPAIVRTSLSENRFSWKCSCGESNDVYVGAEFTMGSRLLIRSRYEIEENRDYSMAIILAAMAFDCGLSQLFFKWREIEIENSGRMADQQALEDQLRSLGNVEVRIKKVGNLLDPRGFGGFLRDMPNMFSYVREHFPHVKVESAEKDFQRKLFWPRNRILHNGYTLYDEQDAERCWHIAALGLMVLKEMDEVRRGRSG